MLQEKHQCHGASFAFCGVCDREFLTWTWIAMHVERTDGAEHVCDRCEDEDMFCCDCGAYVDGGCGLCVACFRFDQAYEEWMFGGLDADS